MGLQESIIFTLEIVGTIAFAASGAMVGVRKSMDIFGVCVLGVLTAVGGGMTRDIIVGVIPPAVFQRPVYVAVAAVTSCLFFAGMYFKKISAEEKSHGIYEKINAGNGYGRPGDFYRGGRQHRDPAGIWG